MEYGLNDIVEMKKEHPCHKSNEWKIIRMGADIRIKCLGCGASVLMPRQKFEKKLKKGDNLLMAAFGGGFTWGSVYVKWAYNS